MSNLFEHLDIEFEELNKLGIVEITMLKGEKGDVGYPTDAQVEQAVDEWLDEHPEATTTVEDGSITEKKFANGVLENMLVGTANQLLSTNFVKESEPYLFRMAGGNAEIGNRKTDMIVGGSVAWNQLHAIPNRDYSKSENGVTFTDNRDGTFTVVTDANGASANTYLSTSGIYVPQGSVLLWTCTPSGGSTSTYYSYLIGQFVGGNDIGHGRMYKISADGYVYVVVAYIKAGTVITTPIVYKPQIFDLAQMFGTTIADYIYSLEQANAGAGVAFFRKLFTKDYYPYNAGELLHVSGLSSHDTVGFNQFNLDALSADDFMVQLGDNFHAGLWGNVSFSVNNGVLTIDRKGASNAVYFCIGKCYANVPMCVSLDCANGMVYDIDARPQPPTDAPDNTKRFYRKTYGTATNRIVHTFTPTQDGYVYIEFYRGTGPLVETFENINYSYAWDGERDGEYEPYVKHSYPLDDSLTLRGIPKLDSSNNLYYDGDTYEHDGTVTRKYGIVDLGTRTWTKQTDASWTCFSASIPDKNIGGTVICSNYPQGAVFGTSTDKIVGVNANSKFIYVRDSSYMSGDASAFKTAMSGVYLVYELAEPTTESAEPFADPQIVDNWGTEEYVTTSIIPVGHDTKYYEDLKGKIESLPWNLSMIAPVETGTKASKAYSIGQYFLLNHQFCKAKTSIASGTTFTLNTNYEVTTVANELYTALHS